MDGLEDEQRKVHRVLADLETAVGAVESSLEENRSVSTQNVNGLEAQITSLLGRMEALGR